jgi:predicted RNA polymerase sigma factor
LQILCGFSVGEIARGLLISEEATKKRIQRGKKTLAQCGVTVELPAPEEVQGRLDGVLDVL